VNEDTVFTGRPLDPSPEAIAEAREKIGRAFAAMTECWQENHGAVRLDRLAAFERMKEQEK
jgi:hypothetical protein